ncbi:MAG TPA: non-heme iron oxygenase ferredoxin subunit [Clostridiaceae bacterium]|jgi:nitrite reductase/ring-hydroxylating ferredoxin subunit|nr:non-heme iron oxygenase ferredoxin subunit [Clostridiaceae bacterium]
MATEIASTQDLAIGEMMGVEKDGTSLLVANVDGSFYAINNICTHMRCKLSEGVLTGDTVQCPCHGSIFNVKTGAVEKGPANSPVSSYPIEIEGDRIMAEL